MKLLLRVLALLVGGAALVGGLASYQDRVRDLAEAERDAEFLACKLRECEGHRRNPLLDLRCDNADPEKRGREAGTER